MNGRIIQGFFLGGSVPHRALQRMAADRQPPLAAGARPAGGKAHPSPLQARMAPGRPPLVHQPAGHAAQPHGGHGNFRVDGIAIGLARSGGSPLPQAVLAKMEAAFGADFSAVRVHVGPQASRIGAIAFTTGDDLYFAPGQFQPDTISGQQLIGHELAHVIQQREGRVSGPASGVAVVQDRVLEAEADRLGMRAAAHRAIAPAQKPSLVLQRMPMAPARPHGASRQRPSRLAGAVQRSSEKSSSSFSSAAPQSGQVYGIWKNPQYPKGKVTKSDLDKSKVLYIGKTVNKEDVGTRFIQHVTKDSDKEWVVCNSCSYDATDSDEWPYIVRQLEDVEGYTKFDVAVCEQYYIEQYKPKYNKINALTDKKFAMFSSDISIFTTKSQYPSSYAPSKK